jgi:hypothetical protein
MQIPTFKQSQRRTVLLTIFEQNTLGGTPLLVKIYKPCNFVTSNKIKSYKDIIGRRTAKEWGRATEYSIFIDLK